MTTFPRKPIQRKTRKELTCENEQLKEQLSEIEDRLEVIERAVFSMNLKEYSQHVRLYYSKIFSIKELERKTNALLSHFKLKTKFEASKTILIPDEKSYESVDLKPETCNVKPETK